MWDFTVPDLHNYWAEGCIHHNSGKSSIISAACFAITGLSQSEGSRNDNLTFGAERGFSALHFEHDSHDYVIKRNIESSTTTLSLDGKPAIKGSDPIAAEIAKVLGSNQNTLLNNIFIPQGKIDTILNATNTTRLKEFQQTYGLGKAETANKSLAIESVGYSVDPDLPTKVTSASTALAQGKAALEVAKAEVERLSKELTTYAKAEQILRDILELQRTMAAIAEADRAVQASEDEVQKATAAAIEAEASMQLAKAAADKYPALSVLQSALASAERAANVAAAVATYRKEEAAVLQSLAQPLPQDPGPDCTVDKQVELGNLNAFVAAASSSPEAVALFNRGQVVFEEITKLSSQPVPERLMKLMQDIKDNTAKVALMDQGKCPTCGQSTCPDVASRDALRKKLEDDKVAFTLERRDHEARQGIAINTLRAEQHDIKAKLDEITAKAKAAAAARKVVLEREISTYQGLAKTYQAAVAHRAHLEHSLELIRTRLASTEEPAQLADLPALAALVKAANTAASAYALTQHNVAVTASILTSKQAAYEAAKRTRQSLQAASTSYTAEDIEAAKQNAQAAVKTRSALAEAEKLVVMQGVQVDALEASLNTLLQRHANEARDAEWVRICTQARNLLHVSGYPALAMREYNRLVNDRMAYYLSLWEAPFKMWLDDEMQFQVEFNDGSRSHAANRLSGGQRIVAATSFRFAMADTFAAEVGLLVLDEPTMFLDETSIEQFARLLVQIKDLSHKSGRQIILITHERRFQGLFDHVIQVS